MGATARERSKLHFDALSLSLSLSLSLASECLSHEKEVRKESQNKLKVKPTACLREP